MVSEGAKDFNQLSEGAVKVSDNDANQVNVDDEVNWNAKMRKVKIEFPKKKTAEVN